MGEPAKAIPAWEYASDVQVRFVDADGAVRLGPLARYWGESFEFSSPARKFTAFKGQKNFTGDYWAATSRCLVGYESWVERDAAMTLDFDPAVVALASQPFRLVWTDDERDREHTPDYFAISHTELTTGNYLAATQQTFHATVFKQYRALLTAVRREPARHGLDGTFATTTAFVLGLDAGSNWNMLAGFQEWLVVRRGTGHDLTWPILVRHLAPGGWVHPLTQQADTAAVTTLHRLLGDFFDARAQPDGLGRIFRDYQSWLTTQAWHQFETAEPDQIG